LSRSPSEIHFRLSQELSNLRLLALPPHLPVSVVAKTHAPFPALPLPADVVSRLKTTSFAAECLNIAEEILAHRFPLLGGTLRTGHDVRWRRDYASGVESSAVYFRRIPYLDAAKAGDHKIIWELNRHQHLVLLAQAHLLSGQQDFLDEIIRQLESWFEQNPIQCGINWSSALEVAFRALSWMWIYHLVGHRFDGAVLRRFLDGLYRHGLHLEANLSFYFSPNTHLLGEAVALHALGVLFPHIPEAPRWQEAGARVVRNELDRQVREDGSHFEQSTYYHVYALDMFLFHAILLPPDNVFRAKLTRMAAFLDAVIGPSGILPFLGDDDGGRFFHPYGARNRFGLATLATCGALLDRADWIRDPRHLLEQAAWWIGPGKHVSGMDGSNPCSARFADSGLVVMVNDEAQLIADAGPFGPGNAGHSHADTLSLLLRRGEEQLLIDPGSYTYVADLQWRNRFRGTAAHNTVRIDGLDQALPGGPFAWKSRPDVKIIRWISCAEFDWLAAACAYAGVRHRRDIVFSKPDLLIVVIDQIEGEPGEHRIEQFWHFGAPVRQLSHDSFQVGTSALATFETSTEIRLFEGGDYGWISPALGQKSPGPVVCVERLALLPASLAAVIDLSGKSRTLRFRLHPDHGGVDCFYDDQAVVSLAWNDSGIQRKSGQAEP
jgi:hypothetical protein